MGTTSFLKSKTSHWYSSAFFGILLASSKAIEDACSPVTFSTLKVRCGISAKTAVSSMIDGIEAGLLSPKIERNELIHACVWISKCVSQFSEEVNDDAKWPKRAVSLWLGKEI